MGIERRPPRPPARPGGASSRRAATRFPAVRKSPTPIIVGGVCAGAALLVIVIAVTASGGGHAKDPAPPPPAARPVDVSSLESQGLSKCDEGFAIIQRCDELMTGGALTAPQKVTLRNDLERGRALLLDGMKMLDEANSKTGGVNKYDVTRYMKAQKAARDKLRELGGN